MTPGTFLRLLWPDKGPYCLAHPFKPANSTKTVYRHHVFPTISEAVTHVHEQANLQDVYFAMLSLEQDRVWDADKIDWKTNLPGAWAVRKAENMALSKCLFWDLDVGSEAAKYPSRPDALTALAKFIADVGLPAPTLVSSGGGVHVYWHFDRSIPMLQWRELAWHLRQLGEHLGIKMDPTRTIDATSVLRVPDTFNWKDRANPRPVEVLGDVAGAITTFEALEKIIGDAMVRNGVVPSPAPVRGTSPAAANPDFGVQTFNDFGPPPTLDEVHTACGQVRDIIASQVDPKHPHFGELDNTAWYKGLVSTLRHLDKGEGLCRDLTNLHPRSVSDIEAKLHQSAQFPPTKCATLAQIMPWKDTPCQSCQFRDKVPNPLAASRRSTVAPAPGSPSETPSPASSTSSAIPPLPADATPSAPLMAQLMAPSAVLAQALIPNPPLPWKRLKTGEIALERTDKDGNVTTQIVHSHDLYPLRRLANATDQREQQVWRAILPRSGAKDFIIDADVLYDLRRFTSALSHNGVYPNKADVSALQDYMVAYISQLQKVIDADAQSSHLGWANEHKDFILPDKTLCSDGSIKPTSLTTAAERATQFVMKRGDPNLQRNLLRFYKKDKRYLPNQFAVLCSLASPIFEMTGYHGIVVNCSGAAGASKSTTLYTAASLWGDTVMWPINGTNRGATANARMARIASNSNLPTCVDEITHMPAKEAIDLVMSITQPGHRVRLDVNGAEKKFDDGYKSAIMLSTANSSLHSLISQDSAAGTAGSMRVFEIIFEALDVHTKAEADDYLRQLRENHGWIGELFMQFVVANRPAVMSRLHQVMREVDTEARIASSERFWSGLIAAVIVAAEISAALGLLPYDAAEIREWALTVQVPQMRGVVKEEYRDPLAILTDYIAEKNGQIVVVDRATTIGTNTTGVAVAGEQAFATNQVHGAVLGHYDPHAGTLLLLKQAFKEHCGRIGAASTRILDELSQPNQRVVVNRHCRRTLGAGTSLAKGQVWCFVVNMRHPDISGCAPALVATLPPGTATTPAAGSLTAVK